MLLQILKGTPPWVFMLFFALLAIGFAQTRSRTVSTGRVALMPGAFVAFSLYGVIAAFGPQWSALLAGAAGIAIAVLFGRSLMEPAGAHWDPATHAFHLPGSWVPLLLMMSVFFFRYAVSAILAMNRPLAQEPLFALAASFAFGLMSGAFAARALGIFRLRPANAPHSVQSA